MGKGKKSLGEWAFLVGVLLAILGGLGVASLAFSGETIGLVLVVLGLVVGFLNIGGKEAMPFLLASIVLLAAGSAGLDTLPLIGKYIGPVMAHVAVFVAPAAFIVALKSVFELAKK